MIYDTFLYHGETDILELRLNILDKVVDKFVIVEPRQSFSGEPCGPFYEKEKERFKKWEDKIIYYPFNLMEDKELVEQARNSKNTEHGNPYWMKVYYCMETLRKPLVNCRDKDTIFISDVDEIWNPKIPIYFDEKIHGLLQIAYYYRYNNRTNMPWTGSIYLTYKRLKDEIVNNIKQQGDVKHDHGGWHFSYMGGEEEVRRKIVSSRSIYEDKTDSFYGVETSFILQRMKENKDIFPDHFRPQYKFWTDNNDLPEYILEHKEKYDIS